jgi:hypothetical protein
MSLSVSILYSGDSIVIADRLLNQATTFCSYLQNQDNKNKRNMYAKDALYCGMLCIIMLVLVGNYYNLLGLLKIKFLMLELMILLIILGSGAGAATAAGPASPAGSAPPGVAQLAREFCLPLGMIYVSIPRVQYVLRIYRYFSVTVPEVSRL